MSHAELQIKARLGKFFFCWALKSGPLGGRLLKSPEDRTLSNGIATAANAMICNISITTSVMF